MRFETVIPLIVLALAAAPGPVRAAMPADAQACRISPDLPGGTTCGAVTATETERVGLGRVILQRATLRAGAEGARLPHDQMTVMLESQGSFLDAAQFLVPADTPTRPYRIEAGPHGVSIAITDDVAVLLLKAWQAVAVDRESFHDSLRAGTPPGYTPGQVVAADPTRPGLTVAAFREGASDPARTQSWLASGQMIELQGERTASGVWRIMGSTVRPRTDADTSDEEASLEEPATVEVPEGTVACTLGGWSLDRDPQGLNVRAQPDARSRVLGRLAPPFRGPSDTYRTEFDIVGYRDGWFLIENARPPGSDYGEDPPARHPRTYAGRGWVSARLVGGAFANGALWPAELRQAPHADAAIVPKGDGSAFDPFGDVVITRLLACRGRWGLTEPSSGGRGWWRGICSNQVTTCS